MTNENFDFGITYGNTSNFDPSDALSASEEVILALFAYDMSSSMFKNMDVLNQARRDCIQKWQNSHHSEKILYSEVKFASDVNFSHGFTPIKQVDPDEDLVCYGQTVLFEAIQSSLKHAVDYRNQILDSGGDAKIMIFVFTDGEDYPPREKHNKFTSNTIKDQLGEIYGKDETLRTEMDIFVVSIDKTNNSYFKEIASKTGLQVLIQDDNDSRTMADFLREKITVASQSVSSGSTQALTGLTI
jgi:uncharacterized protein YegL